MDRGGEEYDDKWSEFEKMKSIHKCRQICIYSG